MPEKPKPQLDPPTGARPEPYPAPGLPGDLRVEAEKVLAGQPALPGARAAIPTGSDHLIHELEVHQVELEMQNEELRRMQVQLEQSQAQYFDLFDLAPVGYLTLDFKGRIQGANLTAARILDTVKTQLVGRLLTPYLFPADADGWFLALKGLRQSGQSRALELRMVKPSGTVFWAGLQMSLAQDPADEQCLRLALSDISALKEANETRRALEVKMGQAQKMAALGDLTAAVAHAMNNVLASIMATASVREALTTQPEERRATLLIGTACKRGRDMIRTLMAFARPTLGAAAPVDLQALVTDVRVFLESTTLNRVRIVEQASPDPLWVQGEAGPLAQALMNLCQNALEALPDGGTLKLRATAKQGGWAEVSVEDSGGGMAPEVLARAMEPYYTTKSMERSLGLGLSTALGTVQAHGGTLELTSQPGLGTTAKLQVPRIQAPLPVGEPRRESLPAMGPMRVLLVDDEEAVRLQIAQLLNAAGLQVVCAASGQESLDHLGRGDLPDLVILDQNMPGMSGVETLEKLRGLHPGLPVLVASGLLNIGEWPCFRQPGVALLAKPFNLAELKAAMAMVLRPTAPPPS